MRYKKDDATARADKLVHRVCVANIAPDVRDRVKVRKANIFIQKETVSRKCATWLSEGLQT